MVLNGNYLIFIFMNINFKLKKNEDKTLHKLEPEGLIRPAFNFKEYFFFMSNGSMRQSKGKKTMFLNYKSI